MGGRVYEMSLGVEVARGYLSLLPSLAWLHLRRQEWGSVGGGLSPWQRQPVGTMPKCCVGGVTAVGCLPDKVWTLPPLGPRAVLTSAPRALACSKFRESFIHGHLVSKPQLYHEAGEGKSL